MSRTSANTYSYSDSYTEARARAVTDKVYEDLITISMKGLISLERANKIREDLLYFQKKKALDYFQFQFYDSKNKVVKALHYKVETGGTIYRNDESGGIDYYDFKDVKSMGFLVQIFNDANKIKEVLEYTKDWGKGETFEGTSSAQRTYSKDNYGITRNLRE